jgi:hypothetical protein
MADAMLKSKCIFVAKHASIMALIVFILVIITFYTPPLVTIHYLSFLVVAFAEVMYFLYAMDEWKKKFNPKATPTPRASAYKKEAVNNIISESGNPDNYRQTIGQHMAKVNKQKRHLFNTRKQPTQKEGRTQTFSAW